MWKKIIASFVIVTFLGIGVLVPYSEGADDNVKEATTIRDILMVGAIVCVAIALVLTLGSKSAKKQETTPEQSGGTPEKSTSSLKNLNDKTDTSDVIRTNYALFSSSRNFPVALSDSGVVVLKW